MSCPKADGGRKQGKMLLVAKKVKPANKRDSHTAHRFLHQGLGKF